MVSGTFFLFPSLHWFSLQNPRCRHSSLSSTRTRTAQHIIIIEVLQCSLPGKWLGLGVTFSLCRLPLSARSLSEESWKMKTSDTIGIQWHSSLQSSQSGPEKQVSTYFGPNKDWTMGGCVQSLFSYPICRHYPRDLHSHEDNAQGLSSCLNYSSLYLRPPLIFFLAF